MDQSSVETTYQNTESNMLYVLQTPQTNVLQGMHKLKARFNNLLNIRKLISDKNRQAFRRLLKVANYYPEKQ